MIVKYRCMHDFSEDKISFSPLKFAISRSISENQELGPWMVSSVFNKQRGLRQHDV